MTLDEALALNPLVAILRGVAPAEVVAHCEALQAAGIRAVEIPMNSPCPLESVALAAAAMGDRMAVGAGTVLNVAAVDGVKAAGGVFVVSPNVDAVVIARAIAVGLDTLPGFATATEGFAALAAGSRRLKLFPASTYGPVHLKALKAVLPMEVAVWAVGGVGPAQMPDWQAAGAAGFGLGSELYRPGQAPEDTGAKARAAVAAWAG
jgi:2-dehydro-3-deoxyphosphogalactonate aldolase